MRGRGETAGEHVRATAPAPGRSVLSDVRDFFVHRPAIPTLVRYNSSDERQDYTARIFQRLGIDVASYRVLNIHRIGIPAPARLVFELLREPDTARVCWPGHLAALEQPEGDLARVQVYLLGRRESLFGLRNGFLGLRFIPLFWMDLLKVQDSPGPLDVDNARFLLYACDGGYPIGFLGIYVRSSVAELGEPAESQSQLFFMVSFDFYGRKNWPGVRVVNRVWEWVHNRATANMLNRFRDLCRARFDDLRAGAEPSPQPAEPDSLS